MPKRSDFWNILGVSGRRACDRTINYLHRSCGKEPLLEVQRDRAEARLGDAFARERRAAEGVAQGRDASCGRLRVWEK